MVTKIIGKIVFEPEDLTKKHQSQSWKRIAMIMFPCDVHLYYTWFLKKRFNIELNKPIRGAHVTFISEKMSRKRFDEGAQLFNNKKATVFLENEPRSNGEHWWLRAHSPDLENIREAIGLPREPYFTFHMTLGVITSPRKLEHSEYILRQCQRFELISNEPRKVLSSHKLWEPL